MRIDIEYIKNFLEIVLNNEHPQFNIKHPDLKPLWDDDKKLEKLIFHMEILEDQGLIESTIKSSGIGFSHSLSGQYTVSVIPLRLTANGHQFAADLNKPGVIEQLKTSFKDAGPKEAVNIVFTLGKKILEKKLDNFIS